MRDWLMVAVIAAGVIVLVVIGIRALMRGRSVPNKAKLAIIGALVWLLSPVDPLPDVVPVVGILDDLAVLIAVVRYVMDQIQPSEQSTSSDKADGPTPGQLDQRLNQRDALKPSGWRLSDNGQPPEVQ
jgi:uncharacterized membrane protein YkvA (DUF1232 family)